MEPRSLVSEIEAYLKSLLSESPEGCIELSRKDVAELFDCVPSQVTYVINTRFGLHNGYVVQSRRGGGGFIRIYSLFTAPEGVIKRRYEEKEEEDARTALCDLARRGLFTKREFLILGSVLDVLERSLPCGEGDELLLEVVRALAYKGFF